MTTFHKPSNYPPAGICRNSSAISCSLARPPETCTCNAQARSAASTIRAPMTLGSVDPANASGTTRNRFSFTTECSHDTVRTPASAAPYPTPVPKRPQPNVAGHPGRRNTLNTHGLSIVRKIFEIINGRGAQPRQAHILPPCTQDSHQQRSINTWNWNRGELEVLARSGCYNDICVEATIANGGLT